MLQINCCDWDCETSFDINLDQCPRCGRSTDYIRWVSYSFYSPEMWNKLKLESANGDKGFQDVLLDTDLNLPWLRKFHRHYNDYPIYLQPPPQPIHNGWDDEWPLEEEAQDEDDEDDLVLWCEGCGFNMDHATKDHWDIESNILPFFDPVMGTYIDV